MNFRAKAALALAAGLAATTLAVPANAHEDDGVEYAHECTFHASVISQLQKDVAELRETEEALRDRVKMKDATIARLRARLARR